MVRALHTAGIEVILDVVYNHTAEGDDQGPTYSFKGIDNASFHADNLFEPALAGEWARDTYDLVLLDPPRAGAAEILERMPHWRPRRLVYISCHPGSLARDAGILVGAHGFKLTCAGVMDMFPHTTHVESIAVFEGPA